MAVTPLYIGTPLNGSPNIVATANPNRDGVTGTYNTHYTAGAKGGRIDRLQLTALNTTNYGLVRLFVNNALVFEQPIDPNIPSNLNPAFSAGIVFEGGLKLAAGATLRSSTENAEAFVLVITDGGDY